ncbi:Panacea domain-containing protein [Bacillus sp. NPDC094106]|uniref:Panacea domain-containing protein n=1 Tax=Bacillus sp. NPDC094106 TaxID=3363949 RepID=UPI0037F494FC
MEGFRTDILEIAKYFIFKGGNSEKYGVTNMKLHKLLYFAQGFHLAIFNKPPFLEGIYMYEYGPHIESVDNKYQKYTYNTIPEEYNNDFSFSQETRLFLDYIWNIFKFYTPKVLEEIITNDEPWKRARKDLFLFERPTEPLDLKFTKDYFKKEYIVS